MYAIFDLDNTLLDTNHLKALRDTGRWAEVRARLGQVQAFDGIESMWRLLQSKDVYLAVVTHSPRWYAEALLEQTGLTPDVLVAYRDMAQRKPHPDGYLRAIRTSGDGQHGLVVGDDLNDLLAADRVPTRGVYAGWCRNPAMSPADCLARGWH